MMKGRYAGPDIKKALRQQGDKSKNQKRIHVTEKPIILYEAIYMKYNIHSGATVIDTHSGSASHRIAAHKMGVDFTCCEIDPEIFNDQEKQYNDFILNNTTLFEL